MGNLTLHVTITQPENNQQSIEDVRPFGNRGEQSFSSAVSDHGCSDRSYLGEESNGEEMTISSIEEEPLESSGGDAFSNGDSAFGSV